SSLLQDISGGGIKGDQHTAIVDHVQHAFVEQRGRHLRNRFLIAPSYRGRGHISLAAKLHREQSILCRHHCAKDAPVFLAEFLVTIGVEGFKRRNQHFADLVITGDLGLGNKSVVILVVFRKTFGKRNGLDLLTRLVLRKTPAVYVDILGV